MLGLPIFCNNNFVGGAGLRRAESSRLHVLCTWHVARQDDTLPGMVMIIDQLKGLQIYLGK